MKKKPLSVYLINMNKTDCIIPSSSSTRVDGKMVSLARQSYELYLGESLPKHSRIIRTCKNGKCINPNHMTISGKWNKFFALINFETENGCWEWIGAKDGGGYGMGGNIDGRYKAHRKSWEYYYGEIPDGMWVLHKCDNPSCVKPSHLFLGTNQDNMNDKTKKERQSRLFGDRNGRSIMTKEKIIEMRDMYSSGKYSYRNLSKKFGVSMTQTRRIIKKESWSWVD